MIMSGSKETPSAGLLDPILKPNAGTLEVLGRTVGVDQGNHPFHSVGPGVGAEPSGGQTAQSSQANISPPVQGSSSTQDSWEVVGSRRNSEEATSIAQAGGSTHRSGGGFPGGAFGGAGYSPDALGTAAMSVSVDAEGRSRAMIAVEGRTVEDMNLQLQSIMKPFERQFQEQDFKTQAEQSALLIQQLVLLIREREYACEKTH